MIENEREFVRTEINKKIQSFSNSSHPITCKVNCPNCCHVKVSCFPEEIENILSLGVDIDMNHLESQFSDWNNSDKTCVFIKDGNCSIDENKPLSCISHIVNTPAANCKEGSLKPVNMIRVKTVDDTLRAMRKEKGVVILHEEIYKQLKCQVEN